MNFLSSAYDITSFWRDPLYTYIYVYFKKIRIFVSEHNRFTCLNWNV